MPVTWENLKRQREAGGVPGELPVYPDIPGFVPPKYDVGRVRQLAQEEAAPSLRREKFQTIQELQRARAEGERRGNPLAGMLRRGVLEARGQTIADITAGASRTARGIYAPEFQATVEAERSRVEGAREKTRAEFDLRVREFYADKAEKAVAARTPSRRPTTFRNVQQLTGLTGDTGRLSAQEALDRYWGGRSSSGGTRQASSKLYWASDADQAAAMKLSKATGTPVSAYYTGTIATIEQRATLGQKTANRAIEAKYGLI